MISVVSLFVCLQDCLHPFSPWSGMTIFGAVIQIVGQKSRRAFVILSIMDISARSSRILKLCGPPYALLRDGQCIQFSSSKLQWLTIFDFMKLYPLFGRSSSDSFLMALKAFRCFHVFLTGWYKKLKTTRRSVQRHNERCFPTKPTCTVTVCPITSLACKFIWISFPECDRLWSLLYFFGPLYR